MYSYYIHYNNNTVSSCTQSISNYFMQVFYVGLHQSRWLHISVDIDIVQRSVSGIQLCLHSDFISMHNYSVFIYQFLHLQ